MTIKLFEEKRGEFLESLFQLLRIPSVSNDKKSVKKAANWLKSRVSSTADTVELVETPGNPVIIGEWLPQKFLVKEPPTMCFYGHYDVQSPEPLESWESPPFKPEIRNNRIFARGAGDNKGQLFAHLTAIECLVHQNALPVHVQFVLDGEEETGSPHLSNTLKTKKDFFQDVDLIIVSDGPADSSWNPTLVFGARGILTTRFELKTANEGRHSGNFGGIQPNPVWNLISVLQSMRNEKGKCQIDGFYDNVFTPNEQALKAAKELDRDPEKYKEELGISYFGGEQDQPLTHRVMFRPTFNIRGIKAGKVREHAKTIIPHEAVVEIDARLVPRQDPERVKKLIENHLTQLKQRSKQWKALISRLNVSFTGQYHPLYTPLGLPWTTILEEALQEGFQMKPVKLPLMGGSLPIYSLYEVIEQPIYILPFAQPDESNHAPNENLKLNWFNNGVKTSIKLMKKLGEKEKTNKSKK